MEEESADSAVSSDDNDDENDDDSVPADQNSSPTNGNPLVVSLSDDKEKPSHAQVWFEKSLFAGIEDEQDAEVEMMKMKQHNTLKDQQMSSTEHTTVDDSDDSSSDTDFDTVNYSTNKGSSTTSTSKKEVGGKGDTFEVVPVEQPSKRPRELDPEGLALGALLKKSKKSREDLIESGYNRWANNDDNLPDWFVQDEAKHCQKQLPVTKEMVREFKERLKEINARPIKKIAEAKARKKRRGMKKLEKIKKKVQGIMDTPDALDSEKMQQLKKLYQKSKQSSRQSREVQYVVAKKGVGKRVSRPAGVSGRFKVVDPRMKKDSRNIKHRSSRRKNKR